MWRAIKLTVGSKWGWFGIIVGAISLINLGVMYFEVGIGPVLERVVATYKAIVHVGFDYLFFWIDWKMPPWLKDAAALYLLLGAATSRGFKLWFWDRLVRDGQDISNSSLYWTMHVHPVLLWPRMIFRRIKSLFGAKSRFDSLEDQRLVEEEERLAITIILSNLIFVPLAAAFFLALESGIGS